MLKLLLSALMSSGVGERFNGGDGGSLASLTDALKAAQAKKSGGQPTSPSQDPFAAVAGPNSPYAAFRAAAGPDAAEQPGAKSPVDRIKEAFSALKDMHKSPQDSPSPLDNAQWPFGPNGAPSQSVVAANAPSPLDTAQWPHGPMGAPSSTPPQASSPFADFFARNSAMMRDAGSGEYLDPQAAAKHSGTGILNGLFA